MAKKKITQLPGSDTLDGTELLEVVQAGVSKKTTASDLIALSNVGSLNVKVVNVHTSGLSNVGTTETVLDEHVLQDGILANDGESLFGEFWGKTSAIGAPSVQQQIKLWIINNNHTFFAYDFDMNGSSQAWVIRPHIIRVGNTTLKTGIDGRHGTDIRTPNCSTYLDINFSLPITLRITGQASGTGAANNQITSEFSKIYFAPAA